MAYLPPKHRVKASDFPGRFGRMVLAGVNRRNRLARDGHSRPGLRQEGIALVFVLAMLVLVLGVVLAFFSRAALHRQTGSASSAKMKTRLFSETAADFILQDIRQEIEAGSEPDSVAGAAVRRPTLVMVPDIAVRVAPSMAPQRVADAGIANIVKLSRGGEPFFTMGDGYRVLPDRPVPERASEIPTTQSALNGRSFSKERWNRPKLMTSTELTQFSVPDWIYVDREGKNPVSFTADTLPQLARSAMDNGDFVIGRYAYVIYDTGGLIDINVAGNALDAVENARRSRLHQISPDGIGGVSMPEFHQFVAWRSSLSGGNASSAPGGGGLFDPKRTFLEVPAGEQAFVNRQDLLAYAARSGSPIPEAALPFFTTFSRDLNAPSCEPNPDRSKLPATPAADAMNPALLAVRFAADTSIQRPGESPFTARAGTPVMPRRFPLSKLSLFGQAEPDAAEMAYYFGLEKVNGTTWRYTKTIGGRIARLDELTQAPNAREPNFFEILQAGIYTGSLGRSFDDAYTFEKERDKLQNFQIVQIAANIIDQWDSDDYPTCLQYPTAIAGTYEEFFGVENLPYISQIGISGWRPTDDRDRFQSWALFDVWNPHQNARTPPAEIGGFRIVPVKGSGRINVSYLILGILGTLQDALYKKTIDEGGCLVSADQPDIATLNAGREFSFSATGNYSEPTTLGAVPSSGGDTPGLLLGQCAPGIAIPAQGPARLRRLQETINEIVDLAAPYTAKRPDGTVLEVGTIPLDPLGRREYPPGTVFSGLDPAHWLQDGNLISGRFGVKAHNTARLKGEWYFDLQAYHLSDNQWHTYQRIERLGFDQLELAQSPGGSDTLPVILNNTHHSMPDAPKINEFYTWRMRGTTPGLIKADPRTRRFGFSGWSQNSGTTAGNDFLGRSVRSGTGAWPTALDSDVTGGVLNNTEAWCFPSGRSVGRKVSNPFEIAGDDFEVIPAFLAPPQKKRVQVGLFGLVSNNPDALNTAHPARYKDPDGVIRAGDGYLGGIPTALNQLADRPLMLNRPFRSVGELGYVFRDMPWKTLDFFTRNSADMNLLDLFSLDETEGSVPLTGGKVNLNTRQVAVLANLLQASSKQLGGIDAAVPASQLTAAQAEAVAQAIVAESAKAPFQSRGDLIGRVLNKAAGGDPFESADPPASETRKIARESVMRTLGEIGTTRTWNFLIDLVSQTGRFAGGSGGGGDFLVQGEERVWIHVAIDRMTGEILEMRKEAVHE